MASITQRGKRFLVRVRRDGYPTVTKTFSRRADGTAWSRQVEADMESGRWKPDAAKVPTLGQALETYRLTVAAKMNGADTYTYRWAEFGRLSFAAKQVTEVTPFDLSAYRDSQLEIVKPGTVVRKMAMLSAVFTWCMKERGWIERNPAALVSRPRFTDRRDRVLTALELRYIQATAETSRATWLPAALTVLMSSAMRRGELFTLRRKDVNLSAGVAMLHETKAGKPRCVPLAPAALCALRQLLDAAPAGPDAALLPVGDVGSISTRFEVTIRRARAQYATDCAAAGTAPDTSAFADIRLHDLRHHAITAAASRGDLGLPELLAISGHSRPDMAMRYTHLNIPALASKLATLPQTAQTTQRA